MLRQEIDLAISVNLRGVVEGTQTALKSFLSTGVIGTIVNVSSIHARGAFPGNSIYDACKGAIEALTRNVCIEYGHLGIRCNAVAPGAVMTNMGATRRRQGVTGAPPLAALSPMNRVSEPDEIAEIIAFLLSPASRSVNGHVLAADNGMSARVFPFPPAANVGFATPGEQSPP
jgi:NAD(P)-dependent dehydrogenase (short-subunit alcohol dehydrogenase family)